MCSRLPPAENSISLPILYENYCDYLTESNLIKVRGLLIEPAADTYLLAERDIYLENPEIKIRVRGWLGRVPGQGQSWEGAGLMHLYPCSLKLVDTSGILMKSITKPKEFGPHVASRGES